ncbi:glycoside hydrolase family 3 protein [Paenarthrobacter sp. A20]|uniref:glycoside hydrolase family 3 protein n=1 Tax=Paenarthrobacter sp. A20 TaxID=2817891 RepID=UPI00209D6CD0|nr:glycoside hydrolase family 3 C-terminal domain-containing protein [Paenarthrobacter sp. A20]MCP1415559.1 beta-glucosidase [Paenarthrobacter sp. A20]
MTQNTTDADTARSDVAHLSHEQKVALALMDFPAAGFPEMVWTDGPNGVRGAEGATAFPAGLAVAASFDQALAYKFGQALARESLASGRNSILAPGLDIARVPWAGRIAEALGEDPCLVGEIGGPIVAGLQDSGVVAAPKHFVANNFEYLRTGSGSFARRSAAVDVRISARALREVYAEPFRRVLLKYGAASLLSSYNQVNGEYVSESKEILAILREEWGWQGFVVPDFLHAVRDDEKALKAGLDFPALGGTAGRTREMVEALPEEALTKIAERVHWAMKTANAVPATPTTEPLDDLLSQDLAQRILEDGAVLLKNEGLLPLRPETINSIALPGIADLSHLLVMGGSAAVTLSPARIPSLVETLRSVLPDANVSTVAGTLGDIPLPTLRTDVAAHVSDDVTGEERELILDEFSLLNPPEGIGPDWSATLRTEFFPPIDGLYRFSLDFCGEATLSIDGNPVASGFREASPMVQGPHYPVQATVTLQAGVPVTLQAAFSSGPSFVIPGIVSPRVTLGMALPNDSIQQAADAASKADLAIVIVGRVSGEAMDIESLHLPGDQETLIRAVAQKNPRTIVVTCGAGPIVMPWIEDVAAVLHMWNPGERFAPALARLLLGHAEPGGRLPLTFPSSEQLTPVSSPELYPGIDGRVDYDDDLLVGYAWYDATNTEPAFEFGHGLGYTHFDTGSLTATTTDDGILCDIEFTNAGPRAGKVVPQLYVSAPSEAGHPPRMLRAFGAATVNAGDARKFSFTVPYNELTAYDAATRKAILHPGEYVISVGLSSRDIRATAAVTLTP